MQEKLSSLKELKAATASVARSISPKEQLEALTHAFEMFSKESARLESAYQSLQKQYESVYRQLEVKVEELDDTKYYLESIVGSMSQGLIFIHKDGMITTFNTSAQHLLEKEISDVLNKPFWSCFPDELFGFSMEKSLQQWHAPRRSFITIHKGEEEADLEIETTFVNCETSPHRFTHGMIVLIRDVTKLRRLHRIANQNDRIKEIGEMAAMVAHEIRNPLGGIKGFASLLLRDMKDHPESCRLLQHIIQGTDDLNTLVTSILSYSRPIRLELQKTDLRELITESIAHLQADTAVPKNIAFACILPQESVNADIDKRLMRSMLMNLLLNSIQAIEDEGKITVTLNSYGTYIKIIIQDTGQGISQKNIDKIFKPFFTTKPKGHGFGLAEVYRIVQEHHGQIEATSKVGLGTTMTVTLPCEGTNTT